MPLGFVTIILILFRFLYIIFIKISVYISALNVIFN